MPFLCIRSAPFILFTSLTLLSTGCTNRLLSQDSEKEIVSTAADSTIPSAVATLTTPAAEESSEAGAIRPSAQYQQGIDRASSAFVLGRSAQSQDDWSLVARRWQQAIDFMSAVPTSSPSYPQAQTKVKEYRTNLAYAQQQANRSTTANTAGNRVTIRSQPVTILPSSVAPSPVAPPVAAAARPPIASSANSSQTVTQQRTFYAPIVRREGNTPVIQVTFNAAQTFDMILDTGASGTLITDRMAQLLGVVPVAATRVDTASESGVIVPLGYVNSIEVNGAATQNVMVAIAGPQLSTGLLGHDFFGHYDVTIREHEVVFRER